MISARLTPSRGIIVAGLCAVGLVMIAFPASWALAPPTGSPAAPGAPAPGEVAETGPQLGVFEENSEDPFRALFEETPEERAERLFVREAEFRADELREWVPLPAGADTAALLADTPARAAFFGESDRHGGLDASVSEVWEEDGSTRAFLIVRRKVRREPGELPHFFGDRAEWWRIGPDGAATLLKAKPAYELTADELPPQPADGGGD